jgi:hypothetical protein
MCEEKSCCSGSFSTVPSNFTKSDFELRKTEYEERKQFEKYVTDTLTDISNRVAFISGFQEDLRSRLIFIFKELQEINKLDA